MPGKPRKVPAGFVNMHELARIATERGLPFSRTGFKSRLAKGKIQPDATDLNKYRPQALFFDHRVDELLAHAPRPMLRTEGKLSEHGLWRLARQFNSRIYLRMVQRFFKIGYRLTTNADLQQAWRTYRTQKNRDPRTPVPDAIRDQFLEMAKNDQLAGLFADERNTAKTSNKKPRASSVQKRAIRTRPAATQKPLVPPSPPIETTHHAILATDMQAWNSHYKPNIIIMRLQKMLPTYGKHMAVRDLAYLLGIPDKKTIEIVRDHIGLDVKGNVSVAAIRRAFGL